MKIADLHNVQGRFLRSVHLERDFESADAMQGYVVTPRIRRTFDRIADGLEPRSRQRAWRITGDYGSGKSSFALLLARVFAGRDSQLPPTIRKSVDLSRFSRKSRRYLPVLITGSRKALSNAVLRGVAKAVEDAGDARNRFRSIERIHEALASRGGVEDAVAVGLIVDANSELVAKGKGGGLLIILDELGKFLEFAALHPEKQDVFFLQQLAEAAGRSAGDPLFVVGLLHQGIAAYSDQLSQSSQREWEKIAGRYEEITFEQPLEQIVHLIGAALKPDRDLFPRGVKSTAREAMRDAVRLGWYGASAVAGPLCEPAADLYPLHPTVIPVLVRLFSRFGQNERSLFSFLLSNEPFGLQTFASKEASSESFYRLPDLYDYASSSFGNRLGLQSYRNHWNHIDSLIRSFPVHSEIERAVLKAIGLLNLLNSPELVATEEAIALAVGLPDRLAAVKDTIACLHKGTGMLYLRGRAGGYCLWSNTSINLEAAYDEAGRSVVGARRVTSRLKEKLSNRPIVARRHYIQTGNLRHFNVAYCPLQALEATVAARTSEADGYIVIPLCETAEEVRAAEAYALNCRSFASVIIGISEPLNHLETLMREVERWEWVQKNTPELKDDRYAAEEVSRQLASAVQTLEKRVQHYVGLGYSGSEGTSALRWYSKGSLVATGTGKLFLATLSALCDELYPWAPQVHNELINRRAISSAAASARMRLMERMLTSARQELLGMDPVKRPPEMSIYLSVLLNSGLHFEHQGQWQIGEPSNEKDSCGFRPVLQRIVEILRSSPDTRVNVATIFAELRSPPFGVRDGILPLLLCVTLLSHQQELAVYENGTFLPSISNELLRRLARSSSGFDLQYCRIAGVRRSIFDKLLDLLEVPTDTLRTEILDVVRPLCVFVADLPPYARHTQNLATASRAVRECIIAAVEPARLVFTELPIALGHQPFADDGVSPRSDVIETFVRDLENALSELRLSLAMLRDRIRHAILRQFEAERIESEFPAFRLLLGSRAKALVVNVRESELKAFCLRVGDSELSESDWIDSVASLIVNVPPARWKDEDEIRFGERLAEMAKRFLRVEGANFSRVPEFATKSVRLSVTQRDGTERDGVVHLVADEDKQAQQLARTLTTMLSSSRKVSVAAVGALLWELLEGNGAANV